MTRPPFLLAAALAAAIAVTIPNITAADDAPMTPAPTAVTHAPKSTAAPAAPSHAPTPALRFNVPPPALDVTDLDGKPVALADLLGQPVVLQFASLTEPLFRMHADKVALWAKQYHSRVKFILIYTTEAHAADGPDALTVNTDDGYALAAPATEDERIKLAKMAQDRLNLANQTVLVDVWNDATFRRYGSRPNMTFLLDAKGNLAAAYPWMDPPKLSGAIADVLVGRPVAAAHQGPVRADITSEAAPRPPGGDGGLATVALTLDAMTLTDTQKAAILPAVAEYFANLRNVRETLQPKPTPAGQATANPANPTNPTDPALALAQARGSATKLKAALQQNLTAPDYQKVLNALTQAPLAGRLFTDTTTK